jgi:YidC/Oxa1 family membrane protein insertase
MLPETGATLADFGLGDTWYVGNVQKIFVAFHDMTGLPWWLSISATVLTLRIVLFPIVGHFMAHNARMAIVQPALKPLMERLKVANARKDMIEMRNLQTEAMTMYRDNNVNPAKMLGLPLIQAPVFIAVFLALKRMAEAGWPGFIDGGALWFENLTMADPYYILPVASTAATLLVLKVRPCFYLCVSNARIDRRRHGHRADGPAEKHVQNLRGCAGLRRAFHGPSTSRTHVLPVNIL